ncbi:DNA cytosine methyltransferase [Paenibacillus nicotianae]|uniref:Cytosine-specific methyltransferase n=1 Tax=Paenibacillus nicotianae TaxID=1526551 RepID=A0ABW4UWB3_9BACL
MKVADFFCGAGGFSEGFRQAGFTTVFAVDKWLPAVNTHHGNHPSSNTILEDVEKISNLPDKEFHTLVPDTEIIIGSPPCVAFSNSNKSGKGDKELGIRLLESYLRIVARKKFKRNSILKYWILENVPNIEKYIKPFYSSNDLSIEGDFILQVFYNNSGVYNSKNFGVAQNRKRFLCGYFPTPNFTIINDNEVLSLKDIIYSLGEPGEKLNRVIKDPNYNLRMISKSITDHHYIRELATHEWEKARQLKEDKGYMGRMSFPEDINKPARTVMANSSVSSRESIIYKYKDNRFRSPTVRELASIMSFPLDYRFYGDSRGIKSKLVGNAVPPKMAFAFAKSIAISLNEELPQNYIHINHANNIKFVNLNHHVFEINKEKPKKEIARFKYHIPYLIIKAFRVELTNYNSDFHNKKFNWDVEIHKSQGPRAKIYKPAIANKEFDKQIWEKIYAFVNFIEPRLVSFEIFQKNYCLTEEQRKEQLGPNELLDIIKDFILCISPNNDLGNITISQSHLSLPVEIAVGYKILELLIDKMRSLKNG